MDFLSYGIIKNPRTFGASDSMSGGPPGGAIMRYISSGPIRGALGLYWVRFCIQFVLGMVGCCNE